MGADANNEARLRRLEDLEEIRALFVDYGYYLDHGLFADYARLFAEDGEILLGPLGRAKGPAAIQALMEQALGARVGSSYHVIANPIVRLEGDRATSNVTWVVLVRDEAGKPVLPMIGHHADTLVRTAQGWKFLRREGHVDLPSKYVAS
jgi:hypothetical protein